MDKIEQLKNILKTSNNIVFFGGAGMSTESGIPDFRSANGIYQEKLGHEYSPEEMVSHSFFINHPEEFYAFYRKKMLYLDAKPNAGHYALAKLEQMGKLKAVITQNIDGLHQMAGSKNVIELHGSVHRNYCMKCGKTYPMSFVKDAPGIPRCSCGGIVRPDVVLYEEGLKQENIEQSIHFIANADTLIIGGTSLIVYPAAGLVQYFGGKNLVLINKSRTGANSHATLVIHEAIGQVLSQAMADNALDKKP